MTQIAHKFHAQPGHAGTFTGTNRDKTGHLDRDSAGTNAGVYIYDIYPDVPAAVGTDFPMSRQGLL